MFRNWIETTSMFMDLSMNFAFHAQSVTDRKMFGLDDQGGSRKTCLNAGEC